MVHGTACAPKFVEVDYVLQQAQGRSLGIVTVCADAFRICDGDYRNGIGPILHPHDHFQGVRTFRVAIVGDKDYLIPLAGPPDEGITRSAIEAQVFKRHHLQLQFIPEPNPRLAQERASQDFNVTAIRSRCQFSLA